MAQSASTSRVALLQRFVSPKPMSYRAEVIFGPSDLEHMGVSTNQTRILEVRNGLLTSSPAVPGAQFAISDQAKSISALLNNYQAQWQEIAANAKFADRPIQQLRLMPKDGWRYTRVLWLDEQTGVPLKTEIFRKNELIERIQVKSIDFLDLGTGADTPPNGNSKTESIPEISTQSIFYVRNLPTGFVLTSVFNDTTHVQQIYSDGLARVSVFVQSLGALPAAGYSQRGSTGFVVRRSGNVDLVAVGDVPQATLDRFLSGVDAIQQ
jgi:negative regulator of sigma E activity